MRRETAMKQTIEKKCEQCSSSFFPLLTNVKRGGGRFCNRTCFYKHLSAARKNENNPNWNENPDYRAIHLWVGRHLGKPLACQKCGTTAGTTRNFQWANVSGEYKRELSDWIRLCSKCHYAYDNLGEKVWRTRKARYGNGHKKKIVTIPVRQENTTYTIEVTSTCLHADTDYILVDREWDERNGAVNFLGQDEVEVCNSCGAQYDAFEENWL